MQANKRETMKSKLLVGILLLSSTLSAQIYTSTESAVADSKKDACQQALQNAKMNAIEKAGVLVLSTYQSSTRDDNGDISKTNESKLKTFALGITKLTDKYEQVEVTKNYQFNCKVRASFSIDPDEMKEAYKNALQQQKEAKKLSGYYEADGYSEDGQSRYRAFTAATLVAQRNLLDQLTKAKITSLTKLENGQLDDRMAKLLKGSIQGAEVVKKEYDKESRSAHVILRISKQQVYDALNK